MGIINPFANSKSDADEPGPRIRILACRECKSLDVLSWYSGDPRYDTELSILIERFHSHGDRRVGQLYDVSATSWGDADKQAQIRQQIVSKFDPHAETGLGSEAYALRDNFKADAFACWEQHRRTPTCSDYKSDAKRLTPDTQVERKEAGLAKFDIYDPSTERFLCEYCPVHSLVMEAARRKAGLN